MKRLLALLFFATVAHAAQFSLEDVLSAPFASELITTPANGRIAISGTVVGKIVADGRVEIHRNGKVYSDIDTPDLIIEEGAIFQGNCVMGDRKGNVTNIASKA